MRTIGDDARLQALLIADPLVESLLLVHDLHPLDASTRIRRALGRLGVGTEFLGIDDAGVAHVRLGKGCGASAGDVEQVVTDAAPDITGVRFEPREAPCRRSPAAPQGRHDQGPERHQDSERPAARGRASRGQCTHGQCTHEQCTHEHWAAPRAIRNPAG